MLRHILPHTARTRLTTLLDMQYTVEELASELDVATADILASLDVLSIPHKQYIHGLKFSSRYTTYFNPPKSRTIYRHEAYCVGCRSVVTIPKKYDLHRNTHVTYKLFDCPNCGRTASKIIKG